jgi:sensor histidine kinase YesM
LKIAYKNPGGLKSLLLKRTYLGFSWAEVLAWFGFVVMWPTILGGFYFFGGVFKSGRILPPDQFIVSSLVVSLIKAAVTIPFWWIFFVVLKRQSIWKRTLLHLPFGCLYALISILIIYQVKTRFLENSGLSNVVFGTDYNKAKESFLRDPYPWNAILLDTYNLLFHAYNFWLSSQRQLKREQELRELSFQSEIKALKAQIEPHFLFNALNSISASVPPALEKTRILIAQLADTFRYALRVSECKTVSLEDELNFLKTWLALEKQRFGKRLSIFYEIDPKALTVQIPPMLLQPLIENALNHGIGEMLQGGTVTIVCHCTNDNSVYIGISDNGAGYPGDLLQIQNKGIGLNNTARRLELLFNQKLKIQRLPQGMMFSFYLPITASHELKSIDN